jgi:hypothetical protein
VGSNNRPSSAIVGTCPSCRKPVKRTDGYHRDGALEQILLKSKVRCQHHQRDNDDDDDDDDHVVEASRRRNDDEESQPPRARLRLNSDGEFQTMKRIDASDTTILYYSLTK